jgi:hypothetical protein
MSNTVDPNFVMPIVFGIFGLIICYLLPGIIASCRKHHNTAAIWIVTLFLGWSVIAWWIAFVWSFTNQPQPPQITITRK